MTNFPILNFYSKDLLSFDLGLDNKTTYLFTIINCIALIVKKIQIFPKSLLTAFQYFQFFDYALYQCYQNIFFGWVICWFIKYFILHCYTSLCKRNLYNERYLIPTDNKTKTEKREYLKSIASVWYLTFDKEKM